MNWKLFLGILSIVPAVIGYYFYFRDTFTGKTKPHTFSWLIWALLAGNGFLAQVHAHGGIGTWATGLTSLASFSIFAFALWKGDSRPTQLDWVLLVAALSGFILIVTISNKTIALFITLGTLMTAFVMTTIKAYKTPSEENIRSFTLNTIKFIPAIAALHSFSFLTVAYPAEAAAGNALVAGVIYFRAKGLHTQAVPNLDPHT